VATVALVLAVLAWLTVAVGIGLVTASHARTSGCVVDKSLRDAGGLCLVAGGLMCLAVAITAIVSLTRPRVQGRYLVMAATALALVAVGGVVCIVLLQLVSAPHAIPPQYRHQC
jgi:hypothetical protein